MGGIWAFAAVSGRQEWKMEQRYSLFSPNFELKNSIVFASRNLQTMCWLANAPSKVVAS
jgi:hypothetical protein